MARTKPSQDLARFVEGLPEACLAYDHAHELIAANLEGRELLERLRGGPKDPWRLGDVSLDGLIHRVLEGDETRAAERTADPAGVELEVIASRLEPPGTGTPVALVVLRPSPPREEDRRRAERDRLVAHLLPGIAHELRGPLTTISGLAQVLALTPGQPPEVQESIQLVQAQVDRADALLRSVVSFTRGPQFSRDLPVGVNEQVARALELLSYSLRAAGFEIHCDLEPGLPLIATDPEELLHLVLVMVVSALDEAKESGCKAALQLRTRGLPGRIAEIEVTFPAAARPAGNRVVPDSLRRLAGHLGGEVEAGPGAPGQRRIVAGLPGWTDDPLERERTPRVLVGASDLDHAVSCLRALGPLARRTSLARSTEVARRWLNRHPRGVLLVDRPFAANLGEQLPSGSLIMVTPGEEPAPESWTRRDVEWVTKADAARRLCERLAQRRRRASGPEAATGRAAPVQAPARASKPSTAGWMEPPRARSIKHAG